MWKLKDMTVLDHCSWGLTPCVSHFPGFCAFRGSEPNDSHSVMGVHVVSPSPPAPALPLPAVA